MANRVTDPEVRAIIPNTSIADLTPFITTANTVVNRMAATDCGSDLSEDELTQVELWLSAHYAAVSDPKLALVSEQFEGERNAYSRGNSSDMGGIKSTQYGQMANTLSNGCLADTDLMKVSFFSAGSDCCE